MPKDLSKPLPPVKTAEQQNAERRKIDAKFKARLREQRQAEQAKPLTQSLGDLLEQALAPKEEAPA